MGRYGEHKARRQDRRPSSRGAINGSASESLECVVIRSDNEAVVVNLPIEPVERPEKVLWVDPIHKG